MIAEDPACELSRLARDLFEPDVAVVALDPRLDHLGLLPEEAPAVAGARAPRRREFAAGRVAAHRAMTALGAAVAPVPSGPDRAPVWPAQLAGSIAHDAESCVAVVGWACHVRSLGVDVEPRQPLEPALWETICTRGELAWLGGQPAERRGLLARLIFSAKEAAYKCQYPLTRCLFGFETLAIDLARPGGRFRARFEREVAPFRRGAWLAGEYRIGSGRIVTGVVLGRDNPSP